MVIVDTSVWIDSLRGLVNPRTTWLVHELSTRRVGLTDLILCEVLQGVRTQSQFDRTRREMSKLSVFNTGGEELAVISAANYRNLRSRGYTVRKTIDCVIATFCIEGQHWLLHNDRDFEPFEKHLGLKVIHSRYH